MTTVNLSVSSVATANAASSAHTVNSRWAPGGTAAGTTVEVLNGFLEGDNFDLDIPAKAVDRRSFTKVFGSISLLEPRDYHSAAFDNDDNALGPYLLVPGANIDFKLPWSGTHVVAYFTFAMAAYVPWGLLTNTSHADAKSPAARGRLFLDGAQIDDQVRYLPVNIGGWHGRTLEGIYDDRTPNRDMVWTGAIDLGTLAAGRHSFGLGVWAKDNAVMRVRAANVFVIARGGR
jgi:hypothetical protein